ncbi:hypothetical protein NDU88_000338 [Pleurodeles waltl]|uniref:Uncharacterized protein n=1 Tax=Pleurodeles waltl TaxID=8319 RepID=A0AAV7L8B0_PLEWA|nr:hypothetical protein NDU88_000338 [Pleurodeles waltl]
MKYNVNETRRPESHAFSPFPAAPGSSCEESRAGQFASAGIRAPVLCGCACGGDGGCREDSFQERKQAMGDPVERGARSTLPGGRAAGGWRSGPPITNTGAWIQAREHWSTPVHGCRFLEVRRGRRERGRRV